MGRPSISFENVPQSYTQNVDFDGHDIAVTSMPDYAGMMDISAIIKDPASFHGSPVVHDLVRFGPAFESLIGTHDDSKGLFADRDKLPGQGIFILSDHNLEARQLVTSIDEMAQRVIKDNRLYSDKGFCDDYLALAKAGFSLVRIAAGEDGGIPITLERAGYITTRLALGLPLDDEVPGEVRAVTKRSHHTDDNSVDMMVSVKWRDLTDPARIDRQTVEIDDFVSPASGASALALLVAAKKRGGTPSRVVHKSFMATQQGIEFSHKVLQSDAMGEIMPVFYTVGVSKNMTAPTKETPPYYLYSPAVADAGDVLCNYLPEDYEP